jgi:uncharacterized protein (DUF58 family)
MMAIRRLIGFPFRRRAVRADCTTTIVMRQRLPIVLLAGLLVWIVVQPTSLAFTGIVMLGSLLLLAYGWARAMALRVSGERALRYTAVQVGDELEESITLHNASWLPVVWAEFVDRSDLPGYTAASIRTCGGRSTEQRQARATCTRRGVFRLGPWELLMGDPFGLFGVRQVYHQPTEILVYPPLAALPPDLQPRSKKVGDLQRSLQPLSAETLNATTTRPYQPRDPRRHVHWRTTARHNDLFVKVFEPEASSSIWLVPDLDAAVHVGEGNESSLETMVVLLASLASHLLNERLAVGLLLDARSPDTILPQPGSAHFWAILRALAQVQPVASRPLAETLTLARALVSTRDSIVVVTPSLDLAWPDALRQLAGRSQRGGIDAIVLDPASFRDEPPSDDAGIFAGLLAEQGIAARIVRRGDVRPVSGAYGEVRRWEFKTLGTGRVIVRQTPREAVL